MNPITSYLQRPQEPNLKPTCFQITIRQTNIAMKKNPPFEDLFPIGKGWDIPMRGKSPGGMSIQNPMPLKV